MKGQGGARLPRLRIRLLAGVWMYEAEGRASGPFDAIDLKMGLAHGTDNGVV